MGPCRAQEAFHGASGMQGPIAPVDRSNLSKASEQFAPDEQDTTEDTEILDLPVRTADEKDCRS